MISKDTLIEIKALARVSHKKHLKADVFALKAAIIACKNMMSYENPEKVLPIALQASSNLVSLSNISMRLVLLGYDESEMLATNPSFNKLELGELKKQLQSESDKLNDKSRKFCEELSADVEPEVIKHAEALFKHVFATSLSAYIYADAMTISKNDNKKLDAFENLFFDKISKDLLLEPPSPSFLIAALSHDATAYLSAALLISGVTFIALSLMPTIGAPLLAFAGLSAHEGLAVGVATGLSAVGLFSGSYFAIEHQRESFEKIKNVRDFSLLREHDEWASDETKTEPYQNPVI